MARAVPLDSDWRELTAANIDTSLPAGAPQAGQETWLDGTDIDTSFSKTRVQLGQRYS